MRHWSINGDSLTSVPSDLTHIFSLKYNQKNRKNEVRMQAGPVRLTCTQCLTPRPSDSMCGRETKQQGTTFSMWAAVSYYGWGAWPSSKSLIVILGYKNNSTVKPPIKDTLKEDNKGQPESIESHL